MIRARATRPAMPSRETRLNQALTNLRDHTAALEALALGGPWAPEDTAALRRASLSVSRAALAIHSTLSEET